VLELKKSKKKKGNSSGLGQASDIKAKEKETKRRAKSIAGKPPTKTKGGWKRQQRKRPE
jgi:hypothetical protein